MSVLLNSACAKPIFSMFVYLMATNFRNTLPVSMTVIFYVVCCIKTLTDLMTFVDICWYFPLYSHIHCLVVVCQPFIKLPLLTYLLICLFFISSSSHLPVKCSPRWSSITHWWSMVTWRGSVHEVISLILDGCFEGGESPRLDHRWR